MWIKLEKKLLRDALAIDEASALNTVQTISVDQILSETLHFTSETFRKWIRRYYPIDRREDYLPESVIPFALDFARYQLWTRLPNSGDIALDDRRVKAYDNAVAMLQKRPPFKIDPPDDPESGGEPMPYIIVPPENLKFD